MPQSLLFRWFGYGRMPDAVRAAAEGARPPFFAEGVNGWLRRSGRLPGGVIGGGIRGVVGAYALSPRRAVLTVGRHLVVDAAPTVGDAGPAVLRVEADGVHLSVDLGRAVRQGEGWVRLHLKGDLSGALDAAPFRVATLAMPEAGAVALFRAYR